ncbi:D-arabinono-1,4-lactone oxidase [Subtercola boreus]|uniref:Metal chaperone, involved in Zn homeostasis, GTPase of family protein n=1 Tax=Subtercola boreus TaxID=120213 RepID=A0A3E0WCH4_9MICO|nr:D-arabinono-1,4-lactone oxidase [Subtercola boreus]RFA20564.1 metal chaperone, involved in Zn homeostasis, GTPase of family protein [Subtercola boreus]RFA20679.1 metal chaperone, involved in Zn homeostasis, GTPase of family protein [Subtercola boreus]RFA26889.1 metal chaperone, involved in Zn homeostasis, GTPase of family protein [Subtercola boreus]
MTATTQLTYPSQEPELTGEDIRLRNWAKNARLGPPGSVVAPTTEAELQDLLSTSDGTVRMIGSRMSPGRMMQVANSDGTLLDLSALSGLISSTDDTVTFAGSTPLAAVYAFLLARGQMLPASPGVIAEQTLAGALSTGTHGQGLQQSAIAGAALSIRMVLADGSVAEFDRDHPDFGAVQLSLGSLGVITAVTLKARESVIYTCLKTAVSADNLEADLGTWNRENSLVKAWWFPQEGQVQVWKANEASDEEVMRYRAGGGELLAHANTNNSMNDTVESTLRQMRDDTKGVADGGKPLRTMTRFRDFTDVTGDIYQVFCKGIATPQINVEIAVPLARAGEVIRMIKDWHRETRPRMHYPVILRCTGPSDGWLSPSHGQDTCYFGFVVYYAADGSLSEEGESFLRAVERALADEGGRPHWGKYFDESLYDWPALYPQWEAFRRVREALDPQHRFANAFTAALLD